MRRVFRWSAIAGGLFFAYLCYIYVTLPDVRPLATVNPRTTAFMQLRIREAQEDGRKFQIRHQWVPYTALSNSLRRAVLVAEDSAFFDHEGVDFKEIRASLEANWEDGKFTRGGSTITQQLAKNLYLSPSRNPVRKLKELMITRRLEAALTKRRILEIYLNVIEWGDGIFGAEAASRIYFGKPAAALSPDEAALLAGAIINPREHNPARPTRRLLRRQQIIVRRMGIKPPDPVTPVNVTAPTVPAVEPSAPVVDPISGSPINLTPPAPPDPVQSLKPIPRNGGSSPLNPSNPKVSERKTAAAVAVLQPRLPEKERGRGERDSGKPKSRAEQLFPSLGAERHQLHGADRLPHAGSCCPRT
jgi:monofunctional biosynthetic peptidoglycan transglycosylase